MNPKLPTNTLLPALVWVVALIPWLNPYAGGPSPGVLPWLVTIFCICLLWLSKRFSITNDFAATLLLAGILSSLIGLLQYFGNTGFFEPWINHTKLGEAFANLRQRNQFATLTNLALAAVIWLATSRQFSHLVPGRDRWLSAVLGCVLALGNAASQSRTGIAQLVLVCVLCAVWGLWRRADVRNILIAAVVTYAVAAFVLPILGGFDLSTFGIAARLREGDQPCASRITLWSNVLHLIALKPWLGWGWGELDYAHFITLYNQPRFCDILDNAHNLPLHLAVELGVPAAVVICGGFLWWVVRQKPWAERDATRQMAWAVMAVILLHSMLEYPLWYGPFQMAFGVCVTLLWRQKQSLEAKNTLKRASNWPIALILRAQAALILVAFVGYAAWDYRRISQIYLPPESRAAAYRTDTLNKIRDSWLFTDQVQFAELLTSPLTSANALWTFNTAMHLLHYSPEPRVIEKLVESAVLLGNDDDALAYLARYRAAFPEEHMRWAQAQMNRL